MASACIAVPLRPRQWEAHCLPVLREWDKAPALFSNFRLSHNFIATVYDLITGITGRWWLEKAPTQEREQRFTDLFATVPLAFLLSHCLSISRSVGLFSIDLS